MHGLAGEIERRLDKLGGAPALFWETETLTFGDLAEESAKLAGGLVRRGIETGDRVAVGLPNSPALVTTVLAVLRAGAVLVPLNPWYTPDEATYIAGDAQAKLVISHAEQVRNLSERLPRLDVTSDLDTLRASAAPTLSARPEDPAVIVYTSGTTGRPKGAVLSHRALLDNLHTVAAAWRWTERDRLLLTLPCFHLHGLALGLFGSLLAGSSIVLTPRFVAEEVPGLLDRRRCTMFFGVPTMYNRLVALPDSALAGLDLSAMRLWVSGSAPLTAATFVRFETRFGHQILERFGMSEGGFMIAAPYDGPRRPGTVGRPLPRIEVRLVDPEAAEEGSWAPVPPGEAGELVVRGPNLFSGYWRRPDETRRSFLHGFFRSGDIAVEEPDGMIRIVGRRSLDIIKSRGFKVGAVEIENRLQEHPAVAEAAVLGMPDPDLGEAIIAVVSLAPGARLNERELSEFVAQSVAPHKVPRTIVFLDEIPRTGPGKVDKRALAKFLAARVRKVHRSG
jgi:malonyl-CoA/methylmalonyl-CoA synthetase